jgi:E-phenylitaconyl-CoA hydratase
LIAAVNGHAVGGGLELALACDLRIASENATFGLPEVRLATIPAVGGIQKLMRAVPSAVAAKMLLTGRRISAEEALRYGLVTDVVPLRGLRDHAKALAEEIASNGPLATQAVKMLIHRGMNMPFDEAVALEQLLWLLLRDTADRTEGRRAFVEKRQPQYQGR